MTILTRQRWAVPSQAFVDQQHPLARGLLLVVPGWASNGQRELLSGRYGTATSPAVGVGAYGRAMQLDGTNSGTGVEWTFNSGERWAINPPLTVACVLHRVSDNGGNNGTVFGATGGGIGGEVWRLGYIGSNQWKFAFNDGTNVVEVGATSASGFRGIQVMVGTLNSSGSALWLNGVQNATGAGASSINYTAPVKIATGRTQGPLNDIVYLGVAWARVLTAAEIAAFTQDPFSLFAPIVRLGGQVAAPITYRRPVFRRF